MHVVHASMKYVEHLFRESLRANQLAALEKRRPRTFRGWGVGLNKEFMIRELTAFTI